MEEEKIILIGAGNVAHHLAAALLKAGMGLCQIYSKHLESARALGMKTGIPYTADANEVYPDGDIYIFCVNDDALSVVLKSIRLNQDALLLHTSGSQPMELLNPYAIRYGVFYPVQTFSKRRSLDFNEIPICVEGNTRAMTEKICALAKKLSDKVYVVDSAQRRVLHLAAVFACNFPNFLYGIAGDILAESGLPFSILRPLIFETAHKVMSLAPEEAQTGPACRGDESILNAHKALLKNNKELLKLYTQLSELIKTKYLKENPKQINVNSNEAEEMPTLW